MITRTHILVHDRVRTDVRTESFRSSSTYFLLFWILINRRNQPVTASFYLHISFCLVSDGHEEEYKRNV